MGKRLTPLKAIRLKCLDCCGGSRKEVRLCPAKDCPLWPYRFGKMPKDGTELEGKAGGRVKIQVRGISAKKPRGNKGVFAKEGAPEEGAEVLSLGL